MLILIDFFVFFRTGNQMQEPKSEDEMEFISEEKIKKEAKESKHVMNYLFIVKMNFLLSQSYFRFFYFFFFKYCLNNIFLMV